ncbi:TetR/AcrR family transcriptional regulator [Cryptosporangium minutisporangium]|uniref:TetR/AcrR family transcriptional regulator n=1 Tax=Cryptosporangium minutisporangium TaxID=113569 RepID=A0ABP6SY52_9ACTN
MTGKDAGTSNRPLRRDAEQNRLRILAAAREVFAARGVDVTLDDIAHHAGLGVGTVYRRYPSREHLVEALFDEQLDRMVTLAQDAARHPDAWTGLTEFFADSIELLAADRGLRDVLFSRVYGHQRVAKARDRIGPAVDALISRCQQAGVVRPDVTGTDMPLVQFMTAALLEYTEYAAPGLWRRYLTILLDGLRPDATPLPVAAPDFDALAEIARGWHPPRRHAPE